eukprot:gnl/MRDRNA2_/MRDRNA2_198073_c0_seq1.p1 gnl/MRDRNA2_/MRDRNA2_198073_c0~~gnl/MRDRNA2_/MRDRNA2_198073_c0_seq1.p1  ORF type:complete len:153 (+),score=24.73 gnl/MRDRNA2_/MRDRNA2_198073_c0_seq1:28-459(+)
MPPALSGSISFIYAKDFEASCAFYNNLLGLQEAGRTGDNVRFFALPGSYLGVVRQGVSAAANPPQCAADAGKVTNMVGLVCKTASDVDAYYAVLQEQGIIVDAPPAKHEAFGLYTMLARDPGGYIVEFLCFLNEGTLQPVSRL